MRNALHLIAAIAIGGSDAGAQYLPPSRFRPPRDNATFATTQVREHQKWCVHKRIITPPLYAVGAASLYWVLWTAFNHKMSDAQKRRRDNDAKVAGALAGAFGVYRSVTADCDELPAPPRAQRGFRTQARGAVVMPYFLEDFDRARQPRPSELTGDWVETYIVNSERFLSGRQGGDHVVFDTLGIRRDGRLDWELSMLRDRAGRILFASRTLWTSPDTSVVRFNASGEALFAKDYGGDADYNYRCRMLTSRRMICMIDMPAPGHGVEFRRIR